MFFPISTPLPTAYFILILLVQSLLAGAWKLCEHGDSFKPDAVLRISLSNTTLGCIDRYTALVNGSSPGPELRFRRSKAVWIRVWNDMSNENLTMVSTYHKTRIYH